MSTIITLNTTTNNNNSKNINQNHRPVRKSSTVKRNGKTVR